MSITDDDYTRSGIPATYTPSGGAPASVTVIEVPHGSGPDRQVDGKRIVQKTTLSVRQSEVAARVGYRDQFVTTDGAGNSQQWHVVPDGVRENRAWLEFDAEWICDCEANKRPIL